MVVKASDAVTLASITDVKYTRRYYLVQQSTLPAPAVPTTNPPPGSWGTTEPGYTAGATTSLYTTDLVSFSDDTFDYLPVQLSSSYEAAKQAYNKAQAAADAANTVNDQAISRGTDLVTNGTGLLGTNYNFSGFTYVASDAPTGAVGSFLTATASTTKTNDEFIPVDTNKSWIISAQIRETAGVVGAHFYIGYVPYDSQSLSIGPQQYAYFDNTMTTLAADLKSGDTKVQLTSGANWPASLVSPRHAIGIWNYTDASGKIWPAGTYTRNVITDAGATVSGNTITLSTAYTGATVPAGTKVSNNSYGGSYIYCTAANQTATSTWTRYASPPINGVHDGSRGTSGLLFPQGTAKIKILFLLNRDVAGAKQAIASISMSDASAAQSTADSAATAASTAQTTANGKNQILWNTGAPNTAAGGAAGTKAGDIYNQYAIRTTAYITALHPTWTSTQIAAAADNKLAILASWQSDGNTWKASALSETYIPQVDIGTGTYGELDGMRLTAKSVKTDYFLATGALGSTVIADGAITTPKITVNTLNGDRIAANTLTADKIKAYSITSNQINATNIAAAIGTYVKVNAENILTGSLTATLDVSAAKLVAGNAEIGQGIKTFTTDIDGVRVPSTQLGVPSSSDALAIGDVAYISTDGDISGTTVSSDGDMNVGGVPLLGTVLDPAAPVGIMDQFSRSTIVYSLRDLPAISSTINASTNGPLGQIDIILPPGRIYEMKMPWRANPSKQSGTSPAELLWGVRAFWQYTTDGSEPPTPGTSAAELFADSSQRTPAGGGSGQSGILTAEINTLGVNYTTRVKILFIAFTSTQTTLSPSLFSPFDWYVYFSDRGPAANVISAGPPGTSSAKQYVTWWQATDSRTWTSSGATYGAANNSVMSQGASASGGVLHAGCVFNGNAIGGDEAGKTIATALTGATILKVEYRFYALAWKIGKGEIQLRKFTGSTLASTDTVVGSVGTKAQYTAANQAQWVSVPTNYISPTDRGVYLNTADWTFPNSYGAFASAFNSTVANRPQVRITYTRAT